ncbi:MAG: putative DNA-binding regulatory protein [Deltaproteobacteria bacterium]|nr:putative DNA-binding regulatory protein [Deltaproteobacteria bacterium]
MPALVDAFVAALPEAEQARAREDHSLEPALRQAFERGREAHPAIATQGEAFAAFFAPHADDARPASQWLPGRNVTDAYLACAIAHHDPAAVAAFEAVFVPELQRAAARLVQDADLAREVVAVVREKLVVGTDARGPRIADYGGHGELLVWARVIAIRTALTHLRTHQRHLPADDHLWELASPSIDPALAVIKREAATQIKDAFHHALAELSPRQRNLLRQHLLDSLTIDELGAIYQVHRVTAARWLAAARADLWAHTRRRLRQTLGLSDASIGAMLDDIRSTLDLSIERALGPAVAR